MEKNQQVIGLMLMMLLLMLYFWMFGDVAQPPQQNPKPTPTATPQALMPPALPDTARETNLARWQQSPNKTAQSVTLENEDIIVEFSSKGGFPTKVTLKKFVTYLKDTLVLFDQTSNTFAERLMLTNGEVVEVNHLYFDIEQKDKLTLTFSLSDSSGASISKTYRLASKGFELSYQPNTSGSISIQKIAFGWYQRMKLLEQDIYQSRIAATVNFYDSINGLDYLAETTLSLQQERATAPIKWVAFKQKFFNCGLITTGAMDSLTVMSVADENDPNTVKTVSASLEIAPSRAKELKFYFGPNEYKTCKAVLPGHAYEKNVNQGWALFAFINRNLIAPIFHFLEGYTNNYGLIILILVLIIKTLLLPLVYSSYKSMATMRVLKPELDEIKARHGDNMTAIQQEQMALYQSFGVNPLAGCIPLLAQMPVFLALYNFFPNAIELRQKSFLWATDLSSYDSILDLGFNIPFYGDHISLFTLLWVGTTIIQTHMNSQQMASQPAQMKVIAYIMPLMFLFIFNSFSAALTYYYFLSNIITIVQQQIINKFLIDDKKIRAKMEERRARRAAQPSRNSFIQNLQKELENQRNKQKNKTNKKK